MDSAYLQQIHEQLQRRLKRLYVSPFRNSLSVLTRTLAFLEANEVIGSILVDLSLRHPLAERHVNQSLGGALLMAGASESENAAICYAALRICAQKREPGELLDVGRQITHKPEAADIISAFVATAVEPLFDYIEECVDDKRMTLALLKKYKHRCEWFQRSELFTQFKDDTGRGEKVLARSLYQYLHDQGVQFHVEPKSASGEIDMLSAQTGRDRLVADAKLFNPERRQDRGYIVKGFRQVYDYTKDYNECFGYLVIFKTCEQDLAIPTQHQEGGVPFITHNNKTIFLVVIDIYDYPDSASKRGKLKAYEITPAQFVEALA